MSEEPTNTESATVEKIKMFLQSNGDYNDRVQALKFSGKKIFNFNPLDDELMTELFLKHGEEIKPLIITAIILMLQPDRELKQLLIAKLQIKITDATYVKFNEWDSAYEGVPMSSECQVIAVMEEGTYTKYSEFVCLLCDHHTQAKEKEPIVCGDPTCKGREFEIDKTTIRTGAMRQILIQEPLEESKHNTPRILNCIIRDEDVENTYIGQRKKVVGVFRSTPQKNTNLNKIAIHAVSLFDLDDVETIYPDEEKKKFFKNLTTKDDFLEIIIDSIAPEITDESLAKKCVLLSLIGGNDAGRLRSRIHCLLVGDPSTGKSKILEFILLIIQKSGFAVGGSLTGTGITVAMVTLPNKQKIPKAGIIPMCSGGVVMLDELNQVDPFDLGKTYQIMESGEFSYDKGGYTISLVARTTIIAGANPKKGYYNTDFSIVDNIDLPGPLLSRFDFKVNMLDQRKRLSEQKIIQHILEIRKNGVEAYVESHNLLTPHDLLTYVNYAKTFHPVFDEDVENKLNTFYLDMRDIKQDRGSIKMDRRQFESLERMCQSIAKARLSDKVTMEHLDEVIEIYKATLETFGMKTTNGISGLSITSSVTNRDQAFVWVCRKLEKASADSAGDGRFLENEAIHAMVADFPERFFDNDRAESFFNEYYHQGKVSKLKGRFKLE